MLRKVCYVVMTESFSPPESEDIRLSYRPAPQRSRITLCGDLFSSTHTSALLNFGG